VTTAPDYRVQLRKGAAEQFQSLTPVVRRSVSEAIDALSAGVPASAQTEPGELPMYRLRVGPDVTIRLLWKQDSKEVLVVSIDFRPLASAPQGRTQSAANIMLDLAADVRHSIRSLVRAPAFTVGVVMTLAIGLGGATTMFGLVDLVFRGNLPFEEADRLVRIRSKSVYPGGDVFAFNVTPRDHQLLFDGSGVFENVVAQSGSSLSLVGEGPAEYASVLGVTDGWAATLGVRPMLGRTFTSDEESLGRESGVALISHSLWERRFGADPSAVGRALLYDGGSMVVIGVMPPRFAYPYSADVWTPTRLDPSNWQSSDLNVVARLRPGFTIEQAEADSDRLYQNLKSESPGTAPLQGFQVASLRDDLIRDGASSLQSLSLAVFALLLLVCANVVNLFTARLSAKRRESAVRAALGAGRLRLMRTAVVESTILFMVGGAIGLLLTVPLGSGLNLLIPDTLRTEVDLGTLRLSGSVLLFAVTISVLAGALSGLVAAKWAARTELQSVLRSGSSGSTGSVSRLRNGLVIAELALSLVLLVSAGVLGDHSRRLENADLGFETSGLYTAQVSTETDRYGSDDARWALVESLQNSIGAQQGIAGVGITTVNPLCCGDWGASLRIEGLERAEDAPPITIHHRLVTAEYFSTLRIPLVRGRTFSPDDRPGSPPVVIIDEDLANRFWPNADPIGQRIGLAREGAELRTIVGVAAVAYAEGDPRETWYLPLSQDPTARSSETLHVMVRTFGAAPLGAIRSTVAAIDPALAAFGVSSMGDLRGEILSQDRLGALVAVVFATAGLLLAALGLYGLLAYQVELRRKELGTRIALGADGRQVARTVFDQAGRLFVVGLVLGAGLAFGLNTILAQVVDGVRMASPLLYAVLVALLAATALLAIALPARSAAGVDPARVLQGE